MRTAISTTRGRADDVIISAGWTMGAVEIEDALLAHPAVQSAAVIGVPDALRGLVVKAFIVLQPGYDAGDVLIAALQDFVRNRLSQHEYPRLVAFVTDLPRTPAGKINRKALRDQEATSRRETCMNAETKRRFPKITDQALDALRSRINVPIENTLEPWCHEATRDNIRHYAHGIGDDNPLWCDPAYAAKTQYGGIVALPSFLFATSRIVSGYVGGIPASTRCGRAPTGPGTSRSCATRKSAPKRG